MRPEALFQKVGFLEVKGIRTEEVVPGAVDGGGWRTLVSGVGPEGVDEFDVLEGNGAEGGGDRGCWFIFSCYFDSRAIERGREGDGGWMGVGLTRGVELVVAFAVRSLSEAEDCEEASENGGRYAC